jgi:quercetin dioxygenase-like cupin family protein
MNATHTVRKGTYGVFDVLGPTVEFLASPNQTDAPYCVILGTIPPGVSIPLHSHADVESFYVLAGSVRVLSEHDHRFEWLEAVAGTFTHVPGNAKHAFRNVSSEPVVQLITTTPKLGRFFQEVGRRITPGVDLPPPAPKELGRFLDVAARYGYWNASREENAAVGITLPWIEGQLR